MTTAERIYGVLLSETMDLKTYYSLDFGGAAPDVCLLNPDEVTRPEDIRFAACWLPGPDAFAPYPNLEMAMSVGAGVDALLNHPGLNKDVAVCRVRDPHQAHLMAGYAVHEVVHFEREFPQMARNQVAANWDPLPIRAPADLKVVVLGNGSMGAAIVRALVAVGFAVSVACRRPPEDPVAGVTYFPGDNSVAESVVGMNVVINTLPLTTHTENVLNANLFSRLAKGAWLVQIGRGEHLAEADFIAALESGQQLWTYFEPNPCQPTIHSGKISGCASPRISQATQCPILSLSRSCSLPGNCWRARRLVCRSIRRRAIRIAPALIIRCN